MTKSFMNFIPTNYCSLFFKLECSIPDDFQLDTKSDMPVPATSKESSYEKLIIAHAQFASSRNASYKTIHILKSIMVIRLMNK